MTVEEKKRCHLIACAVAYLQKSFSILYNDIPVSISEIEKLVTQLLEKDLTNGLLSGIITDYKISIDIPKNPKVLLKINITK